jgi:hypothetical protein
MHPGWVDTPGISASLPGFHAVMGPVLRDVEAGADTVVWLAATEPPPAGGRFWHDRAARPMHYLPHTRETPADRQALLDHVLDATGLPPAPAS